MFKKFYSYAVLLSLLFLFTNSFSKVDSKFKIDYEMYKLGNGLNVILHADKSDPIVSVAILYHVGSNREIKGRTGFAHLFEHILFQESQHVGQDQFFKKIQDAGGTLNGFTFEDGTGYYEIVPDNALEMVLWMESDRMGWLLSTVTPQAFKNQQDVVQNEKRQRVDNRPYGHTNYVIRKNLYPEDHPYNWQVIGAFEDLQHASLQDVRDFYQKWYGPNNATLVVAGDYDTAQAKKWVEKYFGEIKAHPKVENPKVRLAHLDATKRVYFEDNFAKSPELNMVFPTVQQYSKDSYALELLGKLLSDGKKAPLYKVIVEEKKLAPSVSAFQNNMEIAGDFHIRIRAFPDKNLTDVENSIKEAFTKFETDGFTDKDLDRIKAKTETNFYNGISSILSKSFQLAFYSVYAGSPGFITQDLQSSLDVTKEDVWNVYHKYLKDKPYVLTSFVPKGKTDLIAANSKAYPVVEEAITPESEKMKTAVADVKVEKIPSKFDRDVEPSKGKEPLVKVPNVWETKLANGLHIYGIEQDELPLVQFSLTLKGGHLLDAPNKVGVANLITDLMMEGTKNKTPLELEEAIEGLGASIRMLTTNESIVIQANCLASKFDRVNALVEEILLQPRWDKKEFKRLKQKTIEQINRNSSRPATIARSVFNKLIYTNNNILSHSTLGTPESVASISMNDLKNYYQRNYSPSVSFVSIVGNISKDKAVAAFKPLEAKWASKEVAFPEFVDVPRPEKAQIYFVDVPKAKQSEIRIGYLAMPQTSAEYYPATVMNYELGGSFSGSLNMILREEKGYTYGARAMFAGGEYPGPFVALAAVKSNTTFESVKIFNDEMMKYRNGISEDDLAFTKNALIKSNARRFETLGALRRMLNNIAAYNLPFDYIKQREVVVENMSRDALKALAEKYITPGKMIFLIVGDAETQLEPLKKLGLGDPILLDKNGNPVATGEKTTMK